jgi:hypothetical protein
MIRQRHFPVWDIWPDSWRMTPPAQEIKGTWTAYGNFQLLMHSPSSSNVIVGQVRGVGSQETRDSIERILASPARAMPDPIRKRLEEGWRTHQQPKHGPLEVIIRNDWYERGILVQALLPKLRRLRGDAVRAVQRARGDATAIERLLKDEMLNYETVDAAIAQLRLVIGDPQEADAPLVALIQGLPASLTAGDAAKVIGVGASTLSRWNNATPVWATSNAALFLHLISREGGRYVRANILKLAKWYALAGEHGLQTPVVCP